MCLHSFLSKQDRAHGVGQGTRSRGLGNQPRGWGGARTGRLARALSLAAVPNVPNAAHGPRLQAPLSPVKGQPPSLLKRTARLPPPPLPAGDCLPAHWPVPTLINPAAPGAGVASMPSIGSPRSAPPAPVDAPADPAWPRGALFRPVRCPCLSDAGRGGELGQGPRRAVSSQKFLGGHAPLGTALCGSGQRGATFNTHEPCATRAGRSEPLLAGPSPRPRPARGHGGRSLEAPHLPSAVTSPPAPSPTAFLPWAAGCCV